MKKKLRIIGLLFLVAFIGIQFFPVSRNESKAVQVSDFIETYNPPERISRLLETSCYDCHSNNTNYPWYSYVQPIGWLLEDDISEGKEELNLSEFDTYSKRRKRSKLKSMVHQIKDNAMPLSSYTIMNRDARLTENDKQMIINYLDSLRQEL